MKTDMMHNEKNHRALLAHIQAHPYLRPQDVFKFLYQSSFGCEHLVSSLSGAIEYIRGEYEKITATDKKVLVEPLDGQYSRVDLAYLDYGLSIETLGKLFFASAKKEVGGEHMLKEKIEVARILAREGLFDFTSDEFERDLETWRDGGYPPVHHSDTYRELYHPSYRVISNKYVPFLPLFAKIDSLMEKGRVILAIEGGSASGKSTLGQILSEIYDCNLFHMDDFFLRPEQRTAERYREIGGNIDRERFLSEVLIPLKKGEAVEYGRFDCSTMEITPPERVEPKKLNVIEGAYSMHPELAEYYDFSVFLDISEELQRARIQKRNSPAMAQRFFDEWIPLEKAYFSGFGIKDRCSLILSSN